MDPMLSMFLMGMVFGLCMDLLCTVVITVWKGVSRGK
jgi:hypothetical protein